MAFLSQLVVPYVVLEPDVQTVFNLIPLRTWRAIDHSFFSRFHSMKTTKDNMKRNRKRSDELLFLRPIIDRRDSLIKIKAWCGVDGISSGEKYTELAYLRVTGTAIVSFSILYFILLMSRDHVYALFLRNLSS